MTITSAPHRVVATVVGLAIGIEPVLERAGDLRVHLIGELDAWSRPTFTHAVRQLRPPARVPGQRPSNLVLDLHELNFLDAHGLAALDAGRSALLADGWVVTAGPAQPQVCRLLRLAARAGWLADGPMVADDSTASHLHVPATSEGCPRRPRSVTSVSHC
jgi:anti-anti-sigma regulatory factor